jgi:hypothetical protein
MRERNSLDDPLAALRHLSPFFAGQDTHRYCTLPLIEAD